jgi:hypothetical protein
LKALQIRGAGGGGVGSGVLLDRAAFRVTELKIRPSVADSDY